MNTKLDNKTKKLFDLIASGMRRRGYSEAEITEILQAAADSRETHDIIDDSILFEDKNSGEKI